jgi:hypothetical protein
VAVQEPFQFNTKIAPLRDIEALWNSPEQGVRLVFQPWAGAERSSAPHRQD